MSPEWEFLCDSENFKIYRKPIWWDKEGNPVAYEQQSVEINGPPRQVQAK